MVDSPITGTGLVAEFRRRIGDTVHNYVQLRVSCNDPAATTALIEITDSSLITTIAGGTAEALSLDLFSTDYDTLEKLANYIATQPLYSANVFDDGEAGHASSDLEIIPPKDCLRRDVQLRTRRWSDGELVEFLDVSLSRLNRDLGTSYSLVNIPSALRDMLFLLATVNMYWDQVNNATKRRGVDLPVSDFVQLHDKALGAYESALKSYKDAQPPSVHSLTQEQLDDLGAGEIIVGTQIRRSLRTGRLVPSSVAGYPAVEQVVATYLGGAKIRLDWSRSHASGFHHYELWRGTTADVDNSSEIARPVGSIVATGTKIATLYEPERTLWVDGGTSPLPPGTYYYRLYVYNANGLWAASDVTSATVPV